jgi:hypothetical protein
MNPVAAFVLGAAVDAFMIFIRRATRALLILLVAGVLLNDGARVVGAFSKASAGMKDASNAAVDSVRAAPATSAHNVAEAAAAARGASIVSYAQESISGTNGLQVRINMLVSAPVGRSLLAAPAIGLFTGVPSADWYKPNTITIKLRSNKLVTEYGVS